MDKLTERTIKIIQKGGRILLKRNDGSFIHHHINIAAGPDKLELTFNKSAALEFFNLKFAKTIAPLYNCKVVVAFPKY